MELLIIIIIAFAWQAFANWDAEPMSLNHTLDRSPNLMVVESEAQLRHEDQWRAPLEVSPEKVINVLCHADPVVDIDGYHNPTIPAHKIKISQSDYTSPMSLGHALDIVRAWPIHHPRFEQACNNVMEAEGLDNGELWEKYHNYNYHGEWRAPLEVSPDPYDVKPMPAPRSKKYNVMYHYEPVVDVNGYQLFIGKDSHGPMTYWLQKPHESRPHQLNPYEFSGLIDGDKYGVKFHRALWLAYSNRSVQTIFDGLD